VAGDKHHEAGHDEGDQRGQEGHEESAAAQVGAQTRLGAREAKVVLSGE
jgi:hypothetical protein